MHARVCVSVCVWCMCIDAHMEDRGRLGEIGFLFHVYVDSSDPGIRSKCFLLLSHLARCSFEKEPVFPLRLLLQWHWRSMHRGKENYLLIPPPKKKWNPSPGEFMLLFPPLGVNPVGLFHVLVRSPPLTWSHAKEVKVKESQREIGRQGKQSWATEMAASCSQKIFWEEMTGRHGGGHLNISQREEGRTLGTQNTQSGCQLPSFWAPPILKG